MRICDPREALQSNYHYFSRVIQPSTLVFTVFSRAPAPPWAENTRVIEKYSAAPSETYLGGKGQRPDRTKRTLGQRPFWEKADILHAALDSQLVNIKKIKLILYNGERGGGNHLDIATNSTVEISRRNQLQKSARMHVFSKLFLGLFHR